MYRIGLIISLVILICDQVKFGNCHIAHEPDSDFIKFGRRALIGLYQTFQQIDDRNFGKVNTFDFNKTQCSKLKFNSETTNGHTKICTIFL